MDDYVMMPLRIPAELAERVDAYWHQQRLRSRATALRELLERGLSRHSPDRPQADVAPAKQDVQE